MHERDRYEVGDGEEEEEGEGEGRKRQNMDGRRETRQSLGGNRWTPLWIPLCPALNRLCAFLAQFMHHPRPSSPHQSPPFPSHIVEHPHSDGIEQRQRRHSPSSPVSAELIRCLAIVCSLFPSSTSHDPSVGLSLRLALQSWYPAIPPPN